MGIMSYKTELLRMVALVATTLLLATSTVSAQDSAGAERDAMIMERQRAEKLEKEDKHSACGQAYLDIYKKNPDAAGMDEILYNAGVCFEEGKLVGAALHMYSLLEKRFPNTSRNKKALVRMGSIHGSITNYEQAAEAYERYARRFAGEKDAPYALQNATTYRKAIGHDKEAIANIENFVKKYRKKLKYETSAAIFALASIYERQGNRDMVIKVYKRYIKEIGKSGGSDRLLVANAKIGENLWKQSCKSATHDGVCIKRERARNSRGKAIKSTVPSHCGPKAKVKRALLARDPRLVKEATKYFHSALKMVAKGAIKHAPDERRPAAIYWMAASRFYLNEPNYEKFLTIELPTKLNFSGGTAKEEKKKLESTKRFAQWLADTSKFDGKITREYLEIKDIKGGGAAWAVAAAARAGQVKHSFANALWTAEIPRTVRRGPDAAAKVKQHCTVITADAASLKDFSVRAYGFCLELSRRLNWFNSWSHLCADQLSEMRPTDFPRANEVHGRSDGISDILDTEPLFTKE